MRSNKKLTVKDRLQLIRFYMKASPHSCPGPQFRRQVESFHHMGCSFLVGNLKNSRTLYLALAEAAFGFSYTLHSKFYVPGRCICLPHFGPAGQVLFLEHGTL